MSRPWTNAGDDDLLDLLGTALAPPPYEAPAEREVVVPFVPPTASTPLTTGVRWWRSVGAIAAAATVIAGTAIAVADGGTDGQVVATPATTPSDAAAEALDELDAALAGPDDAEVARAAREVRDRLDHLGVVERDALGPRPDELLAAATARLAPPPATTTSTSTPAPPPIPAPTTTATTVDDHGGDDNSGPGSDDSGGDDNSGPGSDSSGSGSGDD